MDTIRLRTARGNDATLHYRDDTSDLSTLGSTWLLWGSTDDEYHLRDLPPLSGTAIDIGAHIGSVTFALLADHPDLHVIAVEPLADNCAVIRATAAENGWTDRLTLIEGAISKRKTASIAYDFAGDDNLRNHRYIGGLKLGTSGKHSTVKVPGVTLSSLIGDGCAFLKVDCEGCEFDLLSDKAIAKVERIVGEGHPADWLIRVHALLDATHDIEVLDDRGGPGTFRAVRR